MFPPEILELKELISLKMRDNPIKEIPHGEKKYLGQKWSCVCVCVCVCVGGLAGLCVCVCGEGAGALQPVSP